MNHMNQPFIIDLDKYDSGVIKEFNINVKYLPEIVLKLISVIKHLGQYIGIYHDKDIGEIFQYKLSMKYLNITMPIICEFNDMQQHLTILLYNNDRSKIYLKLYLSACDEPILKYIENDRTGVVPSYEDDRITLTCGAYLVHFVHCLVSFIGFSRMRLDDDSHLVIKGTNGLDIRTKLWLYLLMTKGRSWYTKFGYEPSNVALDTYTMCVTDMRNIKLDNVSKTLTKIKNAKNTHLLDPPLVSTVILLVDLIGNSTETLYEYTQTHSMEQFAHLTNNLTQSVFSKKYQIMDETSMIDYWITFPWYEIYTQLLVANVLQVNNNINDCFHRLADTSKNPIL